MTAHDAFDTACHEEEDGQGRFWPISDTERTLVFYPNPLLPPSDIGLTRYTMPPR